MKMRKMLSFTCNYQKICQKVLQGLPQRQKQVIERRFGLQRGERETLESIGRDFGVTRERIRQLQEDGFLRLRKHKEARILKKTFYHFRSHLKKEGGLKREDILLENLAGTRFQNYVYFLLHLGDPFHRFSETKEFYPFWTIEKGLFQKIQEIISAILEKLEKEAMPLSQENLFQIQKTTPQKIFLSSLEIAKKVEKGPLGNFGLISWPEIKPRGVRDKAYLVLKKKGKPFHFRQITDFINERQSFFENSAKREARPQTVHNELIKDARFVLVGRGVYALKEWGYQEGTVREVISSVLRQAKKPLTREEVLNEVLRQRMVKPNTVLLNLNDKNYFLKNNQGKYTLKV